MQLYRYTHAQWIQMKEIFNDLKENFCFHLRCAMVISLANRLIIDGFLASRAHVLFRLTYISLSLPRSRSLLKLNWKLRLLWSVLRGSLRRPYRSPLGTRWGGGRPDSESLGAVKGSFDLQAPIEMQLILSLVLDQRYSSDRPEFRLLWLLEGAHNRLVSKEVNFCVATMCETHRCEISKTKWLLVHSIRFTCAQQVFEIDWW